MFDDDITEGFENYSDPYEEGRFQQDSTTTSILDQEINLDINEGMLEQPTQYLDESQSFTINADGSLGINEDLAKQLRDQRFKEQTAGLMELGGPTRTGNTILDNQSNEAAEAQTQAYSQQLEEDSIAEQKAFEAQEAIASGYDADMAEFENDMQVEMDRVNNISNIKELSKVFPKSNEAEITAGMNTFNSLAEKYGIISSQQKQLFFSQGAKETGGKIKGGNESLNYSPRALLGFSAYQRDNALYKKKVALAKKKGYPVKDIPQPLHIQHGYNRATGKKADQRSIGITAYGGRLGNRAGTTDGWDYRGRGFIQLTGRDNYKKVADTMGISVSELQRTIDQPEVSMEAAMAYWKNNNISMATTSNEATRIINRNTPKKSYDDRERYFKKLKNMK